MTCRRNRWLNMTGSKIFQIIMDPIRIKARAHACALKHVKGMQTNANKHVYNQRQTQIATFALANKSSLTSL